MTTWTCATMSTPPYRKKFLHALLKKYGFTAQSTLVLLHGIQSMQNLKPAKEFPALAANGESLGTLLDAKVHLEDLFVGGRKAESKSGGLPLAVLWAIWGTASENGGSKVIKTAPKELKEKYQQVFA